MAVFSVFTPVGLLPIAVAGHDIKQLVAGACKIEQACGADIPFMENPAAVYAAIRNELYQSGKKIELLVNYHPKLHFVSEWWKQLYGESEGKENKGIFPGFCRLFNRSAFHGSVDTGRRAQPLRETVISIQEANREVVIPNDAENLDGLNFLAGKRVDHINKMAELGTRLAHVDGGVPNLKIELPRLDAYNLGQLLYFFEKGCGISGYLLGIKSF